MQGHVRNCIISFNYQNAADNGSSTITHTAGTGNRNSEFTVPVEAGLEKKYADDYFAASNDTGLIRAFELIVNQIIIQSKYYPTLLDDDQHHLNEADGIVFINTYTAPPTEIPVTPPVTSDNSNIMLWFAILFVSGGTLFATLVLNKKKEKSK